MPVYVLIGIIQSIMHLRRHRPHVLFSKGGFVTLPVVFAAWLNRIPVVIHESDGSLGLANRLSLPFAHTVCVAQAQAVAHIKHARVKHTGSPVRLSFLQTQPHQAIQQFALDAQRPLLLIFGGSQGSARINQCIRDTLDELLQHYQIIHICGSGGIAEHLLNRSDQGYQQYEYITEGFADLLACAQWVIARAGANSIAELQAVQTPALLVPLPTQSSRGDQWMNAQAFVEAGLGMMIDDEDFTSEHLVQAMQNMQQKIEAYQQAFTRLAHQEGTRVLMNILQAYQTK